MDIRVGDTVKIICRDMTFSDPAATKVFVGKVISLFNALNRDGSDNWQIEVRNLHSWFLYKPQIDGGTIEII